MHEMRSYVSHYPDSFSLELERLYPNLFKFAYSLVRNTADAWDLANETVAKALRDADTYTPGTSMKGWLFRILRNTQIDEGRKQITKNKHHNEYRASLIKLYSDDENEDTYDLYTEPNQEFSLQLSDVLYYVSKLKRIHQDAILLSINEDSLDDAALKAGIPIGTMKTRVFYARQKLTKLYEEAAPKSRDF